MVLMSVPGFPPGAMKIFAACTTSLTLLAMDAFQICFFARTSESTESESIRHFLTLYRVYNTLFDTM